MEQNTPTTVSVVDNSKQKSGNGLKIATVIASIIAVCGIVFGIYGMVQSSQKDSQVSDLKVKIDDKTVKIEELETEISNLNNKIEEATIDVETIATTNSDTNNQPTNNNDNKTVTVLLGAVLDKNDNRTVFKIGDCTADGPSVKCPVTVNEKNALISYNSNDNILRLSLSDN